MRLSSDFNHEHFTQIIEAELATKAIVIPHSLLTKMSLFFRRFALTHEEHPEIINHQYGYYRQQIFSHRGKRYALHYALVLTKPTTTIQIKLYTQGQCIVDISFGFDTCLTLTYRPTLRMTSFDSTIESITRDLNFYYFRLPNNEEVIRKAVLQCCRTQNSYFRNHINGKVKLSYYSEQFTLHDPTLMLTRHFRLPEVFGRLISPTLKDYLPLSTPHSFNFEPTFNNADVHKVVGDKDELIQFIQDDFRFKLQLEANLSGLVKKNSVTFRSTTTFSVGSYDRPVITIIRKKPTSYKKIHYIINNNIIKSLMND